MQEFAEVVEQVRRDHHRRVDAFLERHTADLARLADWCVASLAAGGKLLFFGNGGSAADAQHLAAEFVNRFDRPRAGLAAIALTTDASILTSVGNDDAFEAIFARQLQALGRPGDVAIGISTSGDSPNVLAGLDAARQANLRTAALLGRDGGAAAARAELALIVPGDVTARIQEVHILAGHLLCLRIEDLLQHQGGTA